MNGDNLKMLVFDKKTVIFVIVTVVATILVIYLTPLKHLNIIEPKIDDISAAAFYELYTSNPDEYLFIDVRSESLYDELRTEGSLNIPLHVLFDERYNLPKRGKTIVLICSGGRASGVGYHYLEHQGFLNLKRIRGGIEAWERAGLPLVIGEFN